MEREATAAVVDTLRDPYFEADPSGVITFVNRAYYESLGYDRKEDVLGKNFSRFTDPRTIRSVFARFAELYRTGRPIDSFDYHCRRRDGSILVGELVASPVLDNDTVVGTRGIIRDISMRVAAQDILRQAKEAAETRARDLAAINRVAEVVSRTLDLNEILQLVCTELASIFPVRNAGIALLSSDRSRLEVVAFHSNDPREPSALGLELPYRGNRSSEQVIETRRTVVIQNAQNDPRTATIVDLTRRRGTRALMIVPIVTRAEAIGTIGMPALDPAHVFTEAEISLAETIASQIAPAIDNAQLHARTELALNAAERDLEIGRQIQSGFFPDRTPDLPGWEIAARFHAARQVAGDFYDFFRVKGTELQAFVIADVCDKGVGAALFMVLFRSLLRAFSERVAGTPAIAAHLRDIVLSTNNFIARYHDRSNMFATLVFGILDPGDGTIHYINAGHEPPIVLGRHGEIIARLMPTGPAVGLMENLEFVVERIVLLPGQTLVGFTDGTTDAKDASGAQFTEPRLVEAIAHEWTSVFSMLFELDVELRRHVGDQQRFDDITLIALRRKTDDKQNVHAICRKAGLDVLEEIREFVETAARTEQLDPETTFAFKLCGDELCTNIIQHGYRGMEPGFLSLVFEIHEDRARLIITDDGRHFPPDDAPLPDLDLSAEDRPIGGLGKR